jgi:hypothetical protein
MTTTQTDTAAAAKPWSKLAEPPHREGCQCRPHMLSRCYPCRATGEILTGDQWRAREIYDDVHWRGESLVEAVKRQFEHQRYLEQHPERRQPWDREQTDDQLGQTAIAVWFEHDPADVVAVVRHCESDSHDGRDCEPAYDDPDCLAGSCRHTECNRQRYYASLPPDPEGD